VAVLYIRFQVARKIEVEMEKNEKKNEKNERLERRREALLTR